MRILSELADFPGAQNQKIGKSEGLRYVYLGNVPGKSIDSQCPHCLQTVVRRSGSHTAAKLTREGECPQCGAQIAGVWKTV